MPDPAFAVLTDVDVARLPMADAVVCMERAFEKHGRGALAAPARVMCLLEAGTLAFTAGASPADPPAIGFRVYDMKHLNSPQRSALTVVFNTDTGALEGVVAGGLLGQVRTGAIGGVAVKALSRPDSKRLALVGAGRQARTQLPAALAVRDFESIRVYCRTESQRQSFAEEMGQKLGVTIEAADSAEEAVADADVILCTTVSNDPVIRADWLKPGTHINNVGPKFKDGHEVGMDVIDRCQLLCTDTKAQMDAFGDRFLLEGHARRSEIVELGQIVAGTHPGRASDDAVSIFFSLGLAGTEVLLASRLFGS